MRSKRLVPFVQQRHNGGPLPEPIRYTSSHGRRYRKRLVDAHKVAVHEVQGNRRNVVFEFLAEAVSEPAKRRIHMDPLPAAHTFLPVLVFSTLGFNSSPARKRTQIWRPAPRCLTHGARVGSLRLGFPSLSCALGSEQLTPAAQLDLIVHLAPELSEIIDGR